MRLPPLAGCTISTDAIPASCAIISKLTCEASRLIRACVPRIRSFASPRLLIRGSIPASPTSFVSGPGVHQTTVTRPDLFRAYLTEKIGLLIQNHRVAVEIGESDEPIPIHFAYPQDINIATNAGDRPLRDF